VTFCSIDEDAGYLGRRLLVETLATTGTRISREARLQVDDLRSHKDASLMMPVSNKGRGPKRSRTGRCQSQQAWPRGCVSRA